VKSAFLVLAAIAVTPNAMTVEHGAAQSASVTRPAHRISKAIAVTVNEQDVVKVVLPTVMHLGFPADISGVWPLDPGTSELRVRPTTEQPVASTSGAFRITCGISALKFDDPVVYPGEPWRSHLHLFAGNTDVDAFSTAESLRTSGNSTCRGGIFNRSSYWVPALLDMRTSRPVFPAAFQIYYKSGDFNTKGSSDGRTVNGVFVPWQPPVKFQDHKSHMHYGVSVPNAGDPRNWSHSECPASHPVVLPKVSYEISFKVTETVKDWRLVSDVYALTKPAGYSSHGDWFGAWLEQPWRARCISANKDCHSHLLGDGRELY